MYSFRYLVIFLFISLNTSLSAQSLTVGLLYSGDNPSDGYTLFSPEKNTDVFLINNCGEVVNQWSFSERPGLTCYLLENGNLLRAGKDSLEIRDWNNELVWSYAITANGLNQHHDIEVLPNGNILCVVKDIYSNEEIIEAGRDTSLLDDDFVLDKITELQPIGTNEANIVWEWKFKDHLIQEYDSLKANYGNVSMHPELMDVNFINGYLSDYVHVNAIDYNADLDQIILSARHMSELYIIDHSTTTEEAASHEGGNSNKGGDFLWRWGNPEAYQQGESSDRKLFLPHDSKWVNEGYLDEGKITVFNNGGDGTGTFSSIHIITPSIIDSTYEMEENEFLPLDYEWSWNGSVLGEEMNESKKCGVISLVNGNLMMCETSKGQITEITKTGSIEWVYKNPTSFTVADQNDDLTDFENFIFRGEKYPSDYIGFTGQDLTAIGIIENENYLSDSCTFALGVNDLNKYTFSITNPVENNTIQFSSHIEVDQLVIYDINGKMLYRANSYSGKSLNIDLQPGVYLMKIINNGDQEVRKIVFP